MPFEPKILVLHLENIAGTTRFEMLFTGGGIKHLTQEMFSQLKIPVIPHEEQKRIASCLSSLDALITAETQKHEALKIHKKGLMQQLFLPQKRLKHEQPAKDQQIRQPRDTREEAGLHKAFEGAMKLEMKTIRHVFYTTIDLVLFMKNRQVIQAFYDPLFKKGQMG